MLITGKIYFLVDRNVGAVIGKYPGNFLPGHSLFLTDIFFSVSDDWRLVGTNHFVKPYHPGSSILQR